MLKVIDADLYGVGGLKICELWVDSKRIQGVLVWGWGCVSVGVAGGWGEWGLGLGYGGWCVKVFDFLIQLVLFVHTLGVEVVGVDDV